MKIVKINTGQSQGDIGDISFGYLTQEDSIDGIKQSIIETMNAIKGECDYYFDNGIRLQEMLNELETKKTLSRETLNNIETEIMKNIFIIKVIFNTIEKINNKLKINATVYYLDGEDIREENIDI